MKKKVFALLMACAMAVGMMVPAFAETTTDGVPDDKIIVDTIYDSDIAGTEVEYTDGMTLNDVLAYAPKCEVTAILANGETKTLESTWFVDDFDREEFENDPYSVDYIPLYMNTPDGYVLQDEEHAYLYFPQSSIRLIHNSRIITEIVAYNGDKEFNITYADGMTLDDIINQIPCFIDVKTADGKTSTVKSTWRIDADSGDDIAFSKDPSSVKDLHLVMSIPSGYDFSDFDLNDELPQVVVHLIHETDKPSTDTPSNDKPATNDTTGTIDDVKKDDSGSDKTEQTNEPVTVTSEAKNTATTTDGSSVTTQHMSPKTGDNTSIVAPIAIGSCALVAAVIFGVIGLKKKHTF